VGGKREDYQEETEAIAYECHRDCVSAMTLSYSYLFTPPFLSALELSSAEVSRTRRGWTFCPARARPSWIIRGACPLHDLEEVGKGGEEKD
jgi:hypothetical protein